VKEIISSEFGGIPISDHNLSQWRHNGYKNWVWRREAQALVSESAKSPTSADSLPLHQMSDWLSVRYLLAVRKVVENQAAAADHFKVLHNFCRDLVAIRRQDHAVARLKFDLKRLSLPTPL
jgi:hypothetical protein